MTRHDRVTRRLRGLGFEPDGERRWVRRDHPPDRASRRHRLYGWGRGWFIVQYDGDGRFTLSAVSPGRFRWRSGPLDRDASLTVIGKGLTLPETITAIGESLLQQRTSGRLPGWWHLPKGKTP